jgi:hypothetical protein
MEQTICIIAAITFLLMVYDFYTGFKNGSKTTISWTIYFYSTKYPVFPFIFGFLMGHFFAGMHGIGCD